MVRLSSARQEPTLSSTWRGRRTPCCATFLCTAGVTRPSSGLQLALRSTTPISRAASSIRSSGSAPTTRSEFRSRGFRVLWSTCWTPEPAATATWTMAARIRASTTASPTRACTSSMAPALPATRSTSCTAVSWSRKRCTTSRRFRRPTLRRAAAGHWCSTPAAWPATPGRWIPVASAAA